MGAPLLSRSRRAAWRAVAVAALAACVDGPTGTGDRFGNLRINPVLEEGGRPEELGLDRIHIVVRRGDGRTAVDTTLTYDVASDRTYDWLIRLENEADALDVRARVLTGGDSMYAGARDVMLREAWAGEGPVEEVLLDYVGRGAKAESIAISPRDSVITFGDSAQYRASGTDREGRPVTDLVVFWETSDEQVARVTGGGWLTAPARRAKLSVVATTPQNLTDSTTVTFVPAATRVIALEGDGARARVTETLPLAVQVLADDGLGVRGVAVRFEAPNGASVADGLVVSDDDGVARTAGTLGTRPGEHVFTATVDGFPVTRLRATARSGPPATLRFITQPEFATLNEVITPAIEVGVRDAYDNPAPDPGTVVRLGLGENPGDGPLRGSIAVEAVDGVARFADLAIDARGNGYTLLASADGLEAVTSAAFDVTPHIALIRVTPPTATLESRHATQQFTAEAHDPDGVAHSGITFTWSSSDAAVATVDGVTGLATATGHGTATITARAGGKTGTAALAVDLTRTVEAVVVAPGAATLTVRGATQQFTAEARDRDGAVVPAVPFTWTSSDVEVATIDPVTGLASATGHGTAAMTATTGGKTGTAALAVDLTRAVESVVVAPVAVTLTVRRATQQFTAEARDRDGAVVPGVPFTWTSSDGEVATIDPVTGLATATGHGTATLTATAGAKSATAALAVDLTRTVETVVVAPGPVTLTVRGATQQFTAEARDRDGAVVPGVPFTWTSSDGEVATIEPTTGLATASGHGSTTVTATTGPKSGTAILGVDLAATVATVRVSPATATLIAFDATQQLTAEARDVSDNVVPGVPFAWTSGDATVATIDAVTGLATAIGNGTATITAATGTKSGAATVTVAQAVSTVAVTPATATLTALEATVQLSAEARDAGGHLVAGAAFTWTTSDARVATVDASGLVTAAGNSDVTISAAAGGASGSAGVTVRQVAATVDVTAQAVTLDALEATVQLDAAARDANGHLVEGSAFTWVSSDPGVARVSATGLVTAVGNGGATVSATLDGATDGSAVTVSQVVTAVAVTPGAAMLEALEATVQVVAQARDANGHPVAGAVFTWNSSNDGVAMVDAAGLVTAVANGEAIVTAAAAGVSDQASVTVSQAVASVTVTPETATLSALEATLQLEAAARDANGHAVADVAFAWTSPASAVVTVDGSGLVTAVGNGVATVTARSGGAGGAATVTVAQRAAQLAVTPETATLTALEQTVQLAAEARDANGHGIADAVVSWSSSDPAVATVNGSGLVTALGNGDATVSATLDGLTDGAAVTVSQVVTAVAVTPGAATLEALEATVQLAAEARDANGHLVKSAEFAWASTDQAVATVDQTGLVTAVDNGAAEVTATAAGVSARSAVTVSQVVTAVRVTPEEVRLVGLGATAQLSAEGQDANGHLVDGKAFLWISSNPAAATVDQTGRIAAVNDGEASVSATASGVTGTARVIVQIPIGIVIDVKPGSDENPINLRSRGVTPVAILTTAAFDARDADPSTARFAGAAADHWALEDVDGDGDIDMILHFPTQELDLKPGGTIAELTGRTVAGQPFVGRDTVRAF